MGYTFREAKRENAPLVIGIAGPSKSGKTMSALRIAVGLAGGGKIVMINTEGKRGHAYADKFNYLVCDLEEPYSMVRYREVVLEAEKIGPAVIIIDSQSHSHEGVGGMLEQHDKELDKMCGKTDFKKREKMTWAAWVKPKADEAQFVNTLIRLNCHVILCLRAKEKLKIIRGENPVNLGWQPIASDRVHFETDFTLVLPPETKGIPDLSASGSEMREPYDTMIPAKKLLDEGLGKRLAEYASVRGSQEPEGVKTETEKKDEPTGDNSAFLNVANNERERIGDDIYFKVLGGHGFESAEDITDRDKQTDFYKELREKPDKK